MASEADRQRGRRTGRRLALAAIFEADFGQRTAEAILERHLAESERDPVAADLARELVAAVVRYRESKGPFREWRDLLKVEGVDRARIEAVKDRLAF